MPRLSKKKKVRRRPLRFKRTPNYGPLRGIEVARIEGRYSDDYALKPPGVELRIEDADNIVNGEPLCAAWVDTRDGTVWLAIWNPDLDWDGFGETMAYMIVYKLKIGKLVATLIENQDDDFCRVDITGTRTVLFGEEAFDAAVTFERTKNYADLGVLGLPSRKTYKRGGDSLTRKRVD
jgi:hypothetical protein